MASFWSIPLIGPLIGPLIFAAWRADARRKYRWIRDWVSPQDTIVEIGSGPGSVLSVLRDHGLTVEGLDISDSSFNEALRPALYHGEYMPYPDDHFDTALLLTMLHHTKDPDLILREARRIARRLIIIEDVYDGVLQRRLTKITDSITNLEFFGHPHTNRTDEMWLASLHNMGLIMRHHATYRVAGLFRQAVYVADRPDAVS